MDIAEDGSGLQILYIYIPLLCTCHADISYYQVQSNGSRGLNTLCYDIYSTVVHSLCMSSYMYDF
jgi:hypothetical protein